MTKHTPGPWTFETPMGDELPWIVQAGKPAHQWKMIAQIVLEDDVDDVPREEAMWNMHLMVAAPDMLAALNAALPLLGGTQEEALVRTAIAKATATAA